MSGRGTFGVAVKAAIVRDGRMLVIYKTAEESAADPDPDARLDLPGGRIRFGEQPEDALRREVREEVGLDAEPVSPVHAWTYVKGDFQLVGITYACRAPRGDVVLGDEHEAFAWRTLSELRGVWDDDAELAAIFADGAGA